MMETDEKFNVPVGTSFDYIIKDRAERIDSKKIKNNKKMDELIV